MAYRTADANHLFAAQAAPGRTRCRACAAPARASLRRELLCSGLAEAMRALPLLSPVTQTSRRAEASCAWRYARMLAARECSTSAPCLPPSDAVGDLRARQNSLNHTAVARLTNDPALLKLLGGGQLNSIGGVKALHEQVELHGPEEGLRRMKELMRRHLSAIRKEGGEVRASIVLGCQLANLQLTRRAARAPLAPSGRPKTAGGSAAASSTRTPRGVARCVPPISLGCQLVPLRLTRAAPLTRRSRPSRRWVDSVLADIGEPALEELAKKRRLELAGTDLAYGSGSGGIAQRRAKRSALPEHERRVMAAADVFGGSAQGNKVRAPVPPQSLGCQLAPPGQASPQTLPLSPQARMAQGGMTPDGKFKVAVEIGEVRAPGVPGLSTCAPPADARRSAPPTQARTRSRGCNIFPFKTRESLLPLIDALDKKGELGKCAHAGRPGTLKKGQFSLVVRGSAGKPSAHLTAAH